MRFEWLVGRWAAARAAARGRCPTWCASASRRPPSRPSSSTRLATGRRDAGLRRGARALVDELGQLRVDPGRFYAAVRACRRRGSRRAAYAEELAALVSAYRRELERLGRPDAPLAAGAALEAPAPRARALGRDAGALLRLRRPDAAPAGGDRHAGQPLRGRGLVLADLRGRARGDRGPRDDLPGARRARGRRRRPRCEPRDDHYAPAARAGALGDRAQARHRGERRAGRRATRGVALLEGGGERAEAELVAAHVARG